MHVVRDRAFATLTMLVVTAIGVSTGVPAFASPDPAGQNHERQHSFAAARAAPVQRYTVPASVRPEAVALTAEVAVVEATKWIAPATGELRDGFGPRPRRPVAGVSAVHEGQDIGAACGDPIRAAARGRVVAAGWGGSYGNRVIVRSDDGLETVYAHASKLLIGKDMQVTAGTRIADVGSTGASTGCHLHFEVHVHGKAVDPVTFMLARGVKLGS